MVTFRTGGRGGGQHPSSCRWSPDPVEAPSGDAPVARPVACSSGGVEEVPPPDVLANRVLGEISDVRLKGMRLSGQRLIGMRPSGMRPNGMRPTGMRPNGMRLTGYG